MKRSIIYISTCILVILFACYCFYVNGYLPAINSSTLMNINATNTFAVIITGVFAGLTSLLTLENIRKISIRSFEEQLNYLIKRQMEIREQLKVESMFSENISKYVGIHYFEELYYELIHLYVGVKSGGHYNVEELEEQYNWRNIERQEIPDWLWDENMHNEAKEDVQMLRMGKVMSKYDNPKMKEGEDVLVTAYKHVFRRYRAHHISYYRHLVYLLKYIMENTEGCLLKKHRRDYVRLVKANMSEYEITMLYYFAKAYDKEAFMEELGMFKSVQYLIKDKQVNN